MSRVLQREGWSERGGGRERGRGREGEMREGITNCCKRVSAIYNIYYGMIPGNRESERSRVTMQCIIIQRCM